MAGIQSTKNYDKFKLIQGNRNVIPGHVGRLTNSILRHNMLAQNPIIVNEKFEVIDGQHRLEVARNNQLDVYYLIIPGAHFTEIIALNANNRPWVSKDYVNSYASQGKPDYLWLIEFMDTYGISVTEAICFIFGSDSTGPRAAVKNGKLELNDAQKERANSRADALWSIRPFIKRSGFIPRAFLIELIHLHDEGKIKKLIEGVKKRREPFMPEANRKGAFNQLHLMMA